MRMTIAQRILASFFLLTLFSIILISGTYYALFRKDIQSLSRRQIEIAFDMMFDKFQTQITEALPRIDSFINYSLAGKLNSLYEAREHYDFSNMEEHELWRNFPNILSLHHGIVSAIGQFAPLLGTNELVIYDKNGKLAAAYLHTAEQEQLGIYLEYLYDGSFISSDALSFDAQQLQFLTLYEIQELSKNPLPDGISAVYEGAIPNATIATISRFGTLATLKFITPITYFDEHLGMCVLQISIRQGEVDRYARFSQTEVNIFAGTDLSVGTLPEYTTVSFEMSPTIHVVDFVSSQSQFPIEFSEQLIAGQQYTQGRLVMGRHNMDYVVLTANFPHQVIAQRTQELLTFVGGVGLGCGVLALIASLSMSSRINRRIQQLITYLNRIAKGEIPPKITETYRGEFGQIRDNLNTLIDATDETTRIAEAIANGRLDVEVRERSEHDRLMQALNQMIRRLNESTQRILEENTERKRAEEALQQAKDLAEAANRAKSEFLANMSHELRTPLNGILGYVQVLQRNKQLSPFQEAIDSLHIIRKNGEYLLMLINDILDLSKIEAHKLELSPAAFNFPTFLNSIANIICLRLEQKEIRFVYEAETQLPASIRADEKCLREVLLNLLGNALKFTDSGGTVAFRVYGVNELHELDELNTQTLRFEVEDTGIGIPPSQMEKIFLPFEQPGDKKHRAAGTGLGLAISAQLVKMMGGKLQVKSPIGKGSLFQFEIEVPVVDAPEGRQQTIPPEIIGYEGVRRKVLVVDDQPDNRSVLVKLLALIGFELEEVESGEHAIIKADDMHPDIILMDIVMPGMTGLETTRTIRQMPGVKDVPIIGVSASAFESDKQQARLAGCNDFLVKPVDSNKLFTLLEKYLQLEWICEEAAEKENAVSLTETKADGETGMIPPPSEKMDLLYDLAMSGDMKGIRNYADDLEQLDPKYSPFARRLREFAKGFQDKKILALVEYYMKEKAFGTHSL